MKISSSLDESVLETTVKIVAKTAIEEEQINLALNAIDKCVIGSIDELSFRILFSEILYFESVDKICFAYTLDKELEMSKRLYELEETMPYSFLRVSKSLILNLGKVESFSRSFNGRIVANMTNKEKVIISRFYVKHLKEKLKGEIL